MKRYIALLFLFTACLHGFDMQTANVHIKLIPKIAMLDKDIESKLDGGKLVIAVTCDPSFCDEAKEVAALISNNFTGGIHGKSVRAIAVETSAFAKTQAGLAYILNRDEINIKKVIQTAKTKKIISFAYQKENVEDGAILGASIERNIVIILNRSSMRESNIRFVDSFYRMVRMVD